MTRLNSNTVAFYDELELEKILYALESYLFDYPGNFGNDVVENLRDCLMDVRREM